MNDVTRLADELIENQSEVSEHAVEMEQQKEDDRKKAIEGKRDSKGFSFHTDIHKVDEHGNPILTNKGLLTRKSGVRSGSKVSGNKSTVNVPESSPQNTGQDSRAAAVATVELMGMMGQIIGGPEWALNANTKLTGVDEREAGYSAFTAYFASKEITDVPPGIIVVAWLICYIAPRFSQPITISRWKKVKFWVSQKFSRKPMKQTETKEDRKNAKQSENTPSQDTSILQGS